jgi:hypothetical protein
MAANSINRETIRDAWSDLLHTKLVDGGITDKEYGYRTSDFQNPVSVTVTTSAGSQRMQNPGDQTLDVWILIDTWTFTLYSEKDQTWTPAEAEDKRDLIEKSIADLVQDYSSYEGYWDDVQYAGPTEAGEGQVREEGGVNYFIERIPLKFHVFQG